MLDLRRSTTGFVTLIGHRGALATAPENTMESFAEAVAQGADVLELDIHLSGDRELVVIHDFTVNRTTDGQGFVKDFTLAELKRLDAGSWFSPKFKGARIPRLNDVLEWARRRVWLAIEIKSDWMTYDGIEAVLVDQLRTHGMVDQVMVISFDHRSIERVKEIEPNVATGALYDGRFVDPIMVARSARADVMRPRWPFACAPDAKTCHDNGLAYAPWGAHDAAIWQKLVDMGCDALSADHPAALRALLGLKR